MRAKMLNSSDRIAILLLLLLALPVFYLALFVPFETDTGDSIMHYFFARYAFQDPMLYLDHWAKPFFTLLASPFAQFGFRGMKLFNGLLGLLSAWFAYSVAKKLEINFAWLAILFVFFAPSYFVKLFSGYTEPLFGFILIAGVYLVLIHRTYYSAILLSLLPFVRSEGIILILVFAVFFIIRKNYKATILLATGHLIYSIAGFVAGKNFLWVFTEIPYHVVSAYGKGNLTHYPVQLLLTLGVPLFLLFVTGLVSIVLKWAGRKRSSFSDKSPDIQLLLLGIFLSYFLFHTFSWGFGLFGSMGMSRVLTAMVPIMGVISLFGFNSLTGWKYKGEFPLHSLVYVPLICYILIFPFLHNPASINWQKELRRSAEMTLMQSMAGSIEKVFPGRYLYYSNPYIGYALNINPFDQSKHQSLNFALAEKKLKPNSLVIWDNWFSIVEENIDSLTLKQNPELKLINRFKTEASGTKNILLLFAN
jgi:hypothetical protein